MFNDTTYKAATNRQKVAHTYELEFSEVKDAFLSIARDRKPVPKNFGDEHLGILPYILESARKPNAKDSWLGGSINDTLGWISGGFTSETIKTAAKRVALAVKKRRRYNPNDGDVVLDRLYGGDPNFYVKPQKRNVKPGLTINADMWFAGSTDANVIGEYGGFLAGLIQSLEARGFDLEVNLVCDVGALMQGDARTTRSQIFYRVKKRGQKSRFHSWSCVLAPTGFRHLLFLGFHVAGAKYGKLPTDHLATALQSSEWGLTYDAKTNEIRITTQQISARSGFEKLTEDAKEAGLI